MVEKSEKYKLIEAMSGSYCEVVTLSKRQGNIVEIQERKDTISTV